jgi:type VI secretion system secreted protein VgrG
VKGGGYNEMTMDDTKGKEKISVHAQYDMSTVVEHDDTLRVVAGNRTISVETGTHTETIKGDTSVVVLSGNYSHTVQTGEASVYVKGDVAESFDGHQSTKVGKTLVVDAGDEITLKSGASTITLAKDGTITIGCKHLSVVADADIKLSAPKVEILGGDEAKLGVGNQQMTCDKAKVSVSGAGINSSAVGTHEITGALVKIN